MIYLEGLLGGDQKTRPSFTDGDYNMIVLYNSAQRNGVKRAGILRIMPTIPMPSVNSSFIFYISKAKVIFLMKECQ